MAVRIEKSPCRDCEYYYNHKCALAGISFPPGTGVKICMTTSDKQGIPKKELKEFFSKYKVFTIKDFYRHFGMKKHKAVMLLQGFTKAGGITREGKGRYRIKSKTKVLASV